MTSETVEDTYSEEDIWIDYSLDPNVSAYLATQQRIRLIDRKASRIYNPRFVLFRYGRVIESLLRGASTKRMIAADLGLNSFVYTDEQKSRKNETLRKMLLTLLDMGVVKRERARHRDREGSGSTPDLWTVNTVALSPNFQLKESK